MLVGFKEAVSYHRYFITVQFEDDEKNVPPVVRI